MPDPSLARRSIDDLIRDLGAADVATRDRAQAELTRRALGSPALDDEISGLLPRIADLDVEVRLKNVLRACRYYIRICSVVVFPRSDWWDGDVEFRFGAGPQDVSVQTPSYHLEAGNPKKLGPFGVQIFNSAQAVEILDCGDPIDHEVYVEAVGFGSARQRIHRRCMDGESHLYWPDIKGNPLRFTFKVEIQMFCGRTPPWAKPC